MGAGDIRDDPAVLDAFDKLGTILEHRDHVVRYTEQQAWDWFMPYGTPATLRPMRDLAADEQTRLMGLGLAESAGYTCNHEDLYWLLTDRLPGRGGTVPPDWWLW